MTYLRTMQLSAAKLRFSPFRCLLDAIFPGPDYDTFINLREQSIQSVTGAEMWL